MNKRDFLKGLIAVPAVVVGKPETARAMADKESPQEVIVEYSPVCVKEAALREAFAEAPYRVRFVPVEVYPEDPIKIYMVKL